MVVGYVRLSRDEDKENFTSIEEQQSLINNYAHENGINIDRMFIDDNQSGYITCKHDDTLFDRPEFIKMYELVKSGKIKKIIVKDLSRFGRKQSIVVLTLERFREMGCSCIDVGTGKELLNDITPIYSWTHEMLVKDVSRKVRQVFANKQKQGKLLMGNFYYGYKKVTKSDLVIDEEVADCIRTIFSLYLNGMGFMKIAIYLNENTNYPTPSEYFSQRKLAEGKDYRITTTKQWQTHHIYRIISDEIYCGTLVCHKKYSPTIKGQVKRYGKDEYYRFPNHHPAIISKEDYDLAQELRHKRDDGKYRVKDYQYLFSGFCECAECGKAVSGLMLVRKENKPAYNCSEYTRYGRKGCNNKCISEHDLLIRLKQILIDFRAEYYKYLASTDIKRKEQNKENELSKNKKLLSKYESEYRLLQIRKNSELNSKPEEFHNIIIDQYQILENDCLSNIKITMQKIQDFESQSTADIEKKIKTYIDIIDQIIESEKPQRRLLELLIDSIVFNADRTISFNLKIDTQIGKFIL